VHLTVHIDASRSNKTSIITLTFIKGQVKNYETFIFWKECSEQKN